jgi:hypothetical protein
MYYWYVSAIKIAQLADLKIRIFGLFIKGVRESESRTGTWLVSPRPEAQNFFSDLSVQKS